MCYTFFSESMMMGVDLKDDGCGFAGLFIFRGKVAGFVRVKG